VGHIVPTKVNVAGSKLAGNVGDKGMGEVDPLSGHF